MMSSALPSVVLAGGGSAGHISPLLAIADALRRRDDRVPIHVLGTAEGLETRLVPARGYELSTLAKVPFPRKPNAAALAFGGKFVAAIRAAGAVMDRVGADVVVGMGGYVSTPAYLAARRRRLPIVIHEQNSTPGLANRLGSRFADHVLTTFPQTPLPGARCVGMPMRREITTLDRRDAQSKARKEFDLDPDRATLLVTGGSLGAQTINNAMAGAADALRESGVQVLHITGAGKSDGIVGTDSPAPYRVVEYVDRMEMAYAAADAVLCRSGANTVCELTAVGLPAMYVPLAIGNGEQRRNAEPVVAAGGGLMVDNADVTGQWITANALPLLKDTTRLAEMAAAAAAFGRTDADDIVADVVLAAARG